MRRGPSESSALERLGKVIADCRRAGGKTQEDVAHAAGLSEQFLRRIESGRGNPSFLSLLAISKALDVPLVDIVKDVIAGTKDAG
jgi:transcriptional regulator with XRE-family HTH domain